MSLTKVLVPVCDTENSINGLQYAISLAKIINFELFILHVSSESEKKKLSFPSILKNNSENKVLYNEIIRSGETVVEILKVASELESELIIMSPDIFSKRKEYYEQSITRQILKKSKYPVLIIPPNIKFNPVNNIVIGVDMREKIQNSIKETLNIFRVLNPKVDVIVFSDEEITWHFKQDVFTLIEISKHDLEYPNISDYNTCRNEESFKGLAQFSERIKSDLICIENDAEVFYNLFFNNRNKSEISYFHNKPVLILPKAPVDIIKKG